MVNCKEISNFYERVACEATLENGVTGVNATLELARPASEIVVNEEHLIFEENATALKLPVKVHLENPLLGNTCYIGSSASPIIWNLTTGTTSPPPPNAPITGTSGKLEFIEGSQIAVFSKVGLVDNAWSAPSATGCGGPIIELILDPIINKVVVVPAAAGLNTASLENDAISVALAEAVNKH